MSTKNAPNSVTRIFNKAIDNLDQETLTFVLCRVLVAIDDDHLEQAFKQLGPEEVAALARYGQLEQDQRETECPTCGHHHAAHDEDGRCEICQDNLDDLPGGAQGAHVGACREEAACSR
jgi:Zn finger protein HypA/HybF involved in hydrogenase expression